MPVQPAPQDTPDTLDSQDTPDSAGPRTVEAHRNAVEDLLRTWFRMHAPAVDVVPLSAAAGRVLAADVQAPRNLPPFTNSQMDGYAVRSADLAAPDGRVRLALAAHIPAGSAPSALEPGTAAPVMTGAMLPEGADAVVPVEACLPDRFLPPGTEGTVELPAGVRPGSYVRRAGSDIAAGALALPGGTVLGPLQLGLLAGMGLGRVSVRARAKVLLLTTGDEVREPGEPLGPGQIHDANTTLLRSALEAAGAEVPVSRILADSPEDFRQRLRADLDAVTPDLVLTSGGISKGAYEVVRQALATEAIDFLSVAMQPGGPQGIGTVEGIPFLGFPGNPVSSLVSFEMFLRPALTAVTGGPRPRTEVSARLAAPLESPPGKHQIRRGRYTDGTVEPVGGPGSHLIHALAASNALIPVPVGTTHLPAGAEVTVLLLD